MWSNIQILVSRDFKIFFDFLQYLSTENKAKIISYRERFDKIWTLEQIWDMTTFNNKGLVGFPTITG